MVQALASSLGIELLYLSGYSPNLNLIERLGRFVDQGVTGFDVLHSTIGSRPGSTCGGAADLD